MAGVSIACSTIRGGQRVDGSFEYTCGLFLFTLSRPDWAKLGAISRDKEKAHNVGVPYHYCRLLPQAPDSRGALHLRTAEPAPDGCNQPVRSRQDCREPGADFDPDERHTCCWHVRFGIKRAASKTTHQESSATITHHCHWTYINTPAAATGTLCSSA